MAHLLRASVIVRNDPPQENPLWPEKYRDAEAQLGGADTVQKTTYVTTHGGEPEARKGGGPVAKVSSSPQTWIVLTIAAIVVLVAIAYLLGIGR